MKHQPCLNLFLGALFANSAWLPLAHAEAPAQKPDLSGQYQVPGDCYTVDDHGNYHKCRAMNKLSLRQTSSGHYAYNLEVNTFATTSGGCELNGHMDLVADQNNWRLQAPNSANICRVTFAVDKRRLTLVPPPGEDENYYTNTAACRDNVCGSNASLYSDPFLRQSRKALKGK
ncbi:hypothetical protein [Paralysiella testudinis]|uniref:Uncharacterized protein n=1 Tax=Paralysiella testudinis TaxID=2809020 RepID=A0A892ZCB2_9NEIS|nr:hypothetical protein [Paralysiella testudinis]QRQ80651.1 hypothetical protein JQU52_07670 [Paralysiella testudinis]